MSGMKPSDEALMAISNSENQAQSETTVVEMVDHTELVDPRCRMQESGSGLDNNRSVEMKVLPRKEAWIQVLEPAVDLSSNIFDFVPLPATDEPSTASTIASSNPIQVPQSVEKAATADSKPVVVLECKPRIKKSVSFAPTVEDDGNLTSEHVLLINVRPDRAELQSAMDQTRQLERSYIVPDDLPPFGWWDCFQLGLTLTYTTMCLRRSLSSRCLVLEDQSKQRRAPLTATQMGVLARAGLAFNASTQALIVRQAPALAAASPSSPIRRKPRRKKHWRRRSVKYKWMAQVAKRLPSRTNKTVDTKVKHKSKVKLKLKLQLPELKRRIKVNGRSAGSDSGLSDGNKAKRLQIRQEPNKVGARGSIAVFQALRVNTTLVSLCLEHAAIDDSAMSALAAALSVNATLTHLSLAGNRIGPAGARELADALEDSPDSMLLDLDLHDNCLGSQGALELGRALRENETLVRCDFSWNQLNSQAAQSLLDALRDNFVLRELCVYGRDLAGDGTQFLANLDFDCAKSIAVALRHLNDSFAMIRLTSERAALPIDKLKTSRWVVLPDRELLELDGLVISGLLPRNDMLLSLDLRDNPGLGRTAVLALLAAIKCCPTLRHVNLLNVGVFEEAGESVGELVASNSTLETITLHDTTLSVQQLRGNQRAGDVPETMAFTVAPEHFLDRWVLGKCFASNRLTQELNGLRLATVASKTATIVALAANERGCKDLVELNLSSHALELHEVFFLGKKMFHHLNLGRVAFNSCSLDSAAARALADGVRNHATLHTIELENNPLGPIGGQAMAECLGVSSALTFLNLSWTRLGDDGAVAFRDALARNKSLLRLDLRGNELRARGVVAVANGLRRNATLRELHLRWNSVCPAGAEALAVALDFNQSLRVLDIEHHTMGPRGAAAFASMLKRNKQLEQLNMGGTDTTDALDAGPGVGSEQAQRIAAALTTANRSLRVLNVGANQIDADAAASFGELLKFNSTLTALDLSRSGLDAKKAPRFFACLTMNTSLTRLNLSRNCIANDGLIACMRALETNRSLRELNLAHNAITEEPLAVFVTKLQAAKRSIS
ncbi:hypothetical protein BBJ28_00008921, partial [Nothophytophthora sp. Chile5]